MIFFVKYIELSFKLHLLISKNLVPWSNAFWPGLTPFGPPMWQAEADTELTLSASPTTAVGQKALALAKRRYSTVPCLESVRLHNTLPTFDLFPISVPPFEMEV